MKKNIEFIISVLLIFITSNIIAQEARVTIRVADELGVVISNATVNAGFSTLIQPGWGWGGGKPNRVTGQTDTNGICILDGRGNGGSVGISAMKDSYYPSGGYCIDFTNLTGGVVKKWEPWNPTVEITLKKKVNPIPMYAKWVRDAMIPADGQPVGFDLMKGDWTQPQGRGENADIFFRLDRQPEREVMRYWGKQPRPQKLFDITLYVSFPNEGDGIRSVFIPLLAGGSSLHLPAVAPEKDYITNIVKRIYQTENQPSHSDVREDQNYFFRIRTKKDDKGNIVSAFYGKIYGDFSGFDYGKLTFRYYLNPTPNDRNMEFDPKRNLFKNLKSTEEVREP